MYNSIPISQHEYELTISSPWYTCCLFIRKSIYYAHVSLFGCFAHPDVPGRHGDSLSIILHNNVTVDPSPSRLGNTNIKKQLYGELKAYSPQWAHPLLPNTCQNISEWGSDERNVGTSADLIYL